MLNKRSFTPNVMELLKGKFPFKLDNLTEGSVNANIPLHPSVTLRTKLLRNPLVGTL